MNRNAKKLRKPRQYAAKPSRTPLQKKSTGETLGDGDNVGGILDTGGRIQDAPRPTRRNAETLERALSAIEADPLHTKKSRRAGREEEERDKHTRLLEFTKCPSANSSRSSNSSCGLMSSRNCFVHGVA